ncbi:MAG: hypothetical protein JW885_01800 [Deltaproteobacteria bacterium]|nr:hypothetical protein [Candidatus Zymogenaceae bacterium]
MRKISIVALAVLLVAVFAVSSFAAETTFSGNYRIRSVMEYNFDKENVGNAPSDAALYTHYFDQRFRLTVTHKQSEFLEAGFSLDIAEDIWGRGAAMRINEDDSAYIAYAYIRALTPIGLFTVGTKSPDWGKPGWGAGLDGDNFYGPGEADWNATWAVKFGDVALGLVYTKYADHITLATRGALTTWPGGLMYDVGGTYSQNLDADIDCGTFFVAYLHENYKFGARFDYYAVPHTGVGVGRLVKGIYGFDIAQRGVTFLGETPDASPTIQTIWPYPAAAGTPEEGLGRTGLYDSYLTKSYFFWALNFFDGMLVAKGDVIACYGEGELRTMGKAYNNRLDTYWTTGFGGAVILPVVLGLSTPLPGKRLPDDITIEGLGIYADVTFNYDVFSVGLSFLYGSGEKHFHGITQDHFPYIDDSTTFHYGNIIMNGDPFYGHMLNLTTGGMSGKVAPLGLGPSYENLTALKLHFSVCPFDSLDIHGAVIWAKYTQPVGRYARDASGALIQDWHAFYGHPMNYGASNYTYIPADVDDDLGWEIDFGLTWTIMEGLSLNSEFGVLFAGDAFDYRDPVTFEREEWGEIYSWTNTLMYEF